MSNKAGFTLIESLAVIAIIGILVTLAVSIALGAQKNGRDAKRKNDLLAISQGFDARALDRTCNEQDRVGWYPRVSGAVAGWVLVSGLKNNEQLPCAPFSEYLKTIPTDPQSPKFDYYYNLSGGTQQFQHYRLTASLERSNVSLDACQQANAIWVATPGIAYDCVNSTAIDASASGFDSREYYYYIGK